MLLVLAPSAAQDTSLVPHRKPHTKTTAQSIRNTGHWETFRLSGVRIKAVNSL